VPPSRANASQQSIVADALASSDERSGVPMKVPWFVDVYAKCPFPPSRETHKPTGGTCAGATAASADDCAARSLGAVPPNTKHGRANHRAMNMSLTAI
jgi:hypothetical protein